MALYRAGLEGQAVLEDLGADLAKRPILESAAAERAAPCRASPWHAGALHGRRCRVTETTRKTGPGIWRWCRAGLDEQLVRGDIAADLAQVRAPKQ